MRSRHLAFAIAVCVFLLFDGTLAQAQAPGKVLEAKAAEETAEEVEEKKIIDDWEALASAWAESTAGEDMEVLDAWDAITGGEAVGWVEISVNQSNSPFLVFQGGVNRGIATTELTQRANGQSLLYEVRDLNNKIICKREVVVNNFQQLKLQCNTSDRKFVIK